jgi:hypothetical protein
MGGVEVDRKALITHKVHQRMGGVEVDRKAPNTGARDGGQEMASPS